jgi:hypothetical protein
VFNCFKKFLTVFLCCAGIQLNCINFQNLLMFGLLSEDLCSWCVDKFHKCDCLLTSSLCEIKNWKINKYQELVELYSIKFLCK